MLRDRIVLETFTIKGFTINLVEENLSDNSKVYDVEILDGSTEGIVEFGCIDESRAITLWSYLKNHLEKSLG